MTKREKIKIETIRLKKQRAAEALAYVPVPDLYPTYWEQNELDLEIRRAWHSLDKGDTYGRAQLTNAFDFWRDGAYRLAAKMLKDYTDSKEPSEMETV